MGKAKDLRFSLKDGAQNLNVQICIVVTLIPFSTQNFIACIIRPLTVLRACLITIRHVTGLFLGISINKKFRMNVYPEGLPEA
jgi:hypothetical protein